MNGITVFAFLVVGYLLACLFYRIRDLACEVWNFLIDVRSNVRPRE